MRNIQKQMNQLNTDLKRCMDDCKDIYTKHFERLQRERDTALIAASQMEDPNNISAQLPPGVEISNKKVFYTRFNIFYRVITKLLFHCSVLTATETRWLSVRFVEGRPTAPHSVNAKTGLHIRTSAYGMNQRNKSCW